MARKKNVNTEEEPIVNTEQAEVETPVVETPETPAPETEAPAAEAPVEAEVDPKRVRLAELTAISEALAAEGKELADENPELFKEYKRLVAECIAEGV